LELPDDINFWLCGADDPVGDPATFAAWLTEQLAAHRPLAIDTETTGLDWTAPGFVRLVQFGTTTEAWAVPMSWYGRLVHWAMTQVRAAGVPVIMHNAKFDMHALTSAGCELPLWRNVHDTRVLAYLERAGKGAFGLKPLTTELFGSWAGEGQQVLRRFMDRGGWSWATVPVDAPEYWAYGAIDTVLTARLARALIPEGAALPPRYVEEMAYSAVMWQVERRGMSVDVDYSTQLRSAWRIEAGLLVDRLAADGVRDPNSNRHVEAVLRDLGWDPDEFTDTGQAKLDAPVKKRLAQLGGPVGEVAEKLIRYQRLMKWSTAYLDPFIQSGGTVHASINTLGAKHGRSSVSNPPIQQLPSKEHSIREAVIPRAPDQRLVSVDYKGQELRIFAAYAGEAAMIEEFLHGSGDLHALAARTVYGPDFTEAQRSTSKAVNFAKIYGAGPEKMALTAGVTVDEMNRYLAQYSHAFPGVDTFMGSVIRRVRERAGQTNDGHVVTLGGRKVHVPADEAYKGINYLISGSGADVLKDAVLRLDAEGLAEHIVMPVHDELLFSFPITDAAEMTARASELMLDSRLSVPLTVSASAPVERWSHAK
jgi:DNA polymerase-1